MLINDRGKMKFRTVALQPEFLSSLRQMYKEQEYVSQTELDEHQLDYLNTKICEAMEFNQEVSVKYHQNHSILKGKGNIHYFDEKEKRIRLVTAAGECLYIPLTSILDIN